MSSKVVTRHELDEPEDFFLAEEEQDIGLGGGHANAEKCVPLFTHSTLSL